MQNRIFVVIGNSSELLAEQHPWGCHPWHDDVSRIGEQEFAEFARQDEKHALLIAENDDRSAGVADSSESLLMHSIYSEIRLRYINVCRKHWPVISLRRSPCRTQCTRSIAFLMISLRANVTRNLCAEFQKCEEELKNLSAWDCLVAYDHSEHRNIHHRHRNVLSMIAIDIS